MVDAFWLDRDLDADAVAGLGWSDDGRSDPPQATGRWTADDYVGAYRCYCANEKRGLFRWSRGRARPPWLDDYAVDDFDRPDA